MNSAAIAARMNFADDGASRHRQSVVGQRRSSPVLKSGAGFVWWPRVTLAAFLLLASGGPAIGQWTQWGGPSRDFVVDDGATLPGWSDGGPALLWSRELGAGHAGIVSDGKSLFTMTRRGNHEVVIAMSANSGATIWEHAYPATAEAGHELDTTWGSGPNATPLLSSGRLYTLGFTGVLTCLDTATGTVIWDHNLSDAFNVSVPFFGHAASPMQFEDTLIVVAGGALALRLEDGSLVWDNREFEGSYASPVLVGTAGGAQLIAPVAGEVVALHPKDGRLLWRHPYENSMRTFLSGPLVADDDIVVASAYFLGSIGLQLAPGGSGVTQLWENPRLQLAQFNGVRVDDTVYGFHNSILIALDVPTGEILWRTRELAPGSMVKVGAQFLLLDKDGQLSVVSLDRQSPTIHSQAQILEGRSWTAPALVEGRLYARNLERIVAVDLTTSGPGSEARTATPGRPPVAAPAGFLDAKDLLMTAYYRSDVGALADAGATFRDWQDDPELGHLAHYYLGFAAYQRALLVPDEGKLELLREAEELLLAALTRDQTLADAHALLSRIYPMYFRFDLRRARIVGPRGDVHLDSAVRFDPDSARVLAFQGIDTFYSPPEYGGDPERGLELLRRALDRFEEQPQLESTPYPDWVRATAWVWYGQTLQTRDDTDPEEVTDAFRSALALNPEFSLAQELLDRASRESR